MKYAELLVKVNGMWQIQKTAELSEVQATATKWQECGYKTKIRKA